MPQGAIQLDETAVCEACGDVYFVVAGHACPGPRSVHLAGERERCVHADQERRERREAVIALANGDHKIGPSSSCPLCGGPTVVGRTVRTVHATSCPRRVVMDRARAAAAAGAPVRRPVVAVEAVPAPLSAPEQVPADSARKSVDVSIRHVNRQQHGRGCAWTSSGMAEVTRVPRCRVRPSAVLSLQVTGCRVRVGGWPATVTGPIRGGDGAYLVPVEYDVGWDPENVLIAVSPDGKLTTELQPWGALMLFRRRAGKRIPRGSDGPWKGEYYDDSARMRGGPVIAWRDKELVSHPVIGHEWWPFRFADGSWADPVTGEFYDAPGPGKLLVVRGAEANEAARALWRVRSRGK
jgi:hypothetical protein